MQTIDGGMVDCCNESVDRHASATYCLGMKTPTSKVTLTATLPDGRTVSRTTTHAYTHVVAVKLTDEERISGKILPAGSWQDWAWTAQPGQAETRVRGQMARGRAQEVRLIQVN